jgi:hypothetical protein
MPSPGSGKFDTVSSYFGKIIAFFNELNGTCNLYRAILSLIFSMTYIS